MSVATYTKSGTKATTPVKLDKAVFGVEANHLLLKDAYLSYMAQGRDNLAVAKKRGQVRGGGIKPWRQKGTGRARFGSSRNPIWRGGGVAFGPTGNENYSRKLNIKSKHQAVRQALSLAAAEDRIKIIDNFVVADGKVKSAAALLQKIEANGNVLLVLVAQEPMVERATGNLSAVKTTTASYLNVFDILNAETVVIAKDALEPLSAWLGHSISSGQGATK